MDTSPSQKSPLWEHHPKNLDWIFPQKTSYWLFPQEKRIIAWYQGIGGIMDLGDFDCKPALTRAFQRCKALSKVTRNNDKCPILTLFGFQNGGKHGDDYLEFSEFRIFLATLRQYFEYFEAFKRQEFCLLRNTFKTNKTGETGSCAGWMLARTRRCRGRSSPVRLFATSWRRWYFEFE